MKSVFKSKFAWLPLVALVSTLPIQAQDMEPEGPYFGEGGSVPINVYSDQFAARLIMQTEVFQKDAYVVIDTTQPWGIEIHRNVIRGLRFGEGEETIKVLGENFNLEIHRDEIRQAGGNMLDTLTAEFEEQNEGMEVVAKIGWATLKNFSMQLDFDTNNMTLIPAMDRTEDDARNEYQLVVTGVQEVDGQLWIPVVDGDNKRMFMWFDTGSYHTRVDRDYAYDRGHPAGDIPNLRFVDGDDQHSLSDMAALMPVQFAVRDETTAEGEPEVLHFDEDRMNTEFLMMSGLSLLTGYSLEVNPRGGYLALTRIKNSNYREEDAEFYAAVSARDRGMLDEFLNAHPEDRNVKEAVWMRFGLGVEAEDPVDVQMAALEKGLGQTKTSDKFRYLNNFVIYTLQSQADPELTIAIGEEALEHVAVSKNPAHRQNIQLILGDKYLDKDDLKMAYSYYFSSAFNGDPRLEALTRVKLATVYELREQPRRAFSSYARALRDQESLPEDLAADAQEGLTRLREVLDPDDPLIEEAENIKLYVANAINIGEPLEVVTAKNLEGVEESLEDYLGQVVLIDVWATWCGPCIAGLPKLAEVADRFKGTDFTVLSVSADDEVDTVIDFIENDTEMPWDHWHIGASSDVHQAWNIRGYPTYMLIDKEGKVLARGHGLTDEMISLIEQNLIQI